MGAVFFDLRVFRTAVFFAGASWPTIDSFDKDGLFKAVITFTEDRRAMLVKRRDENAFPVLFSSLYTTGRGRVTKTRLDPVTLICHPGEPGAERSPLSPRRGGTTIRNGLDLTLNLSLTTEKWLPIFAIDQIRRYQIFLNKKTLYIYPQNPLFQSLSCSPSLCSSNTLSIRAA